jgi:hypothetical protein
MDDSGDFVVVWQSHVVYGEPDAVLAQLFDAGGAPVAAEFQVSLLTGVHRYPAVATDDDGRFVVAWNRQTLESPAEYPVLAIVAQRLATSPATIDIDGDGDVRALTDGLLLLRHRLGLTDTALTSGAVATDCTRCDGAAIDAYIASILADLDLDGDGIVGALTDALLILRFAFGLRGPLPATGAVGENCTRCDAQSIAPHLLPVFA